MDLACTKVRDKQHETRLLVFTEKLMNCCIAIFGRRDKSPITIDINGKLSHLTPGYYEPLLFLIHATTLTGPSANIYSKNDVVTVPYIRPAPILFLITSSSS